MVEINLSYCTKTEFAFAAIATKSVINMIVVSRTNVIKRNCPSYFKS